MYALIAIYVFFVIGNLIISAPKILKGIKEKTMDEPSGDIVALIFLFVPIFNAMIFLFFFIPIVAPWIKKTIISAKKKKHPQIVSLNILKNIHKQFELESNKYFGPNKKTPQILETYVTNLDTINDYLKNNYQKTNISYILLSYEVTFKKVLESLQESEEFNNITRNKILASTHKIIDKFYDEILKIENKKIEIENMSEETIRNRIIKELESDRMYHQKKTSKVS
jgi:hypothetical protein